jgi:hypothetical protein
MREEPPSRESLRQPRTLFARCRGRKIAQPGEALQRVCRWAANAETREIQLVQRDHFVAQLETAGEQGFTALPIALHMVARNGDQLQRLAAGRKQA